MKSKMIEFNANIGIINCRDFSDHLQLLNYICDRFLPICDSSCGYKFSICFFSNQNAVTDVIASLLQMSEIKLSPVFGIEIPICRGKQRQLPVESISNWLELSNDGMEKNVHINKNKRDGKERSQEERFLEVNLDAGIDNVREMLENLTKVNLF